MRLKAGLLYFLSLLLSYTTMLIVMSFNIGFIFTVLLGSTSAWMVFAWKYQDHKRQLLQ